jgi:hypothetical protein
VKFRAVLSVAGKVIKTDHYEDDCLTMEKAEKANEELNAKFQANSLTKIMRSEVFPE